jgi:hypothetical protein
MSLLVIHVIAAAASLAGPQATRAERLPDSYVLRVEGALRLCQPDIVAMQPAADAAAARLSEGGRLLVGGKLAMVGELCGRAGGLMLTEELGSKIPDQRDVVLYFPARDNQVPNAVLESGGLVIVFGQNLRDPGVFSFPNHAQEAGISPSLADAIPGWVFTGELIAALTRVGKMPVIYESIGLYGGVPRINRYKDQGILWHDQHSVPPIAPGVIGNRYVTAVSAMLRRVEAEDRTQMERAGAWASQAKRSGKRVIMYSMGHLIPIEVEKTAIGRLFKPELWNSGFSYLKPPDDTYCAGEVLIHIGYQHPPTEMLERARCAGAQVVYVDILQQRDYVKSKDVIWIDPMWPWADACVPIENYDVPALPASAIVNGAIAWELYRVTERALHQP